MSIKVLIADDDKGIRQMLGALIEREPDLELVGAAGDADEAIKLAERFTPNVALLDVYMPGGGGESAAAGIHAVSPDTYLIALSAEDDASNIVSMFGRGVTTYLVKDAPTTEVLEAIRRGAEQQGGPTPPPS